MFGFRFLHIRSTLFPILAVLLDCLLRLSCPVYPARSFLLSLSCPGCYLLVVMWHLSYPSNLVQSSPDTAVLPCFHILACPLCHNQAKLSKLICRAGLSRLICPISCPWYPIPTILPQFPSPLSPCPSCPVLAVMFWASPLSCPSSSAPRLLSPAYSYPLFRVLPVASRVSSPAVLSYVSCPDILVPSSFVPLVLSFVSCSCQTVNALTL